MLGCLGWGLAAGNVRAAERIYVAYGVLERSIPVASLETYARTGVIDDDLALYAQFAKPQELKQLQSALLSRADLSPVAVAQFLYSPQGETLLRRIGQVIQPESRLSGFSAIRAALILASADPEGLTLLNVLRKFPTRGLRVDVQRSLEIVSALEKVVNQSNRATTVINQQAAQEIATSGIGSASFTEDLRSRGPFVWQKQTLTLIDLNRSAVASVPHQESIPRSPQSLSGRTILVDLYLPINWSKTPTPAPVIVISHGLGSDRSTFVYLAQHLASYGFAVLVPEHPGSNAKQMEALLNGTAKEVAEPAEFVDRPLDVTFMLNQLERQATYTPALQGKLNLQQVGVVGQSFGGYTALALGGAPINPTQLQSDCQNLDTTLNLSLLLQCRALQLNQTDIKLTDPRVKAVMAINPIASAVFGQASISQIKVPTMIVAGNADTVAPALLEQIQPFTWLTDASKSLVLLDRGTHFSTLEVDNVNAGGLQLPEEVVGPNPAIARRYMTALSLAFFKTYVAKQPSYRPYLSAFYAQSISEMPMSLTLVNTLTTAQLSKGITNAGVASPSAPSTATR